jgi:hypothetical protein
LEDRVFPIGRLDKMSEGLILLTNLGEIVNKILRSENNHEKEYIVYLKKLVQSDKSKPLFCYNGNQTIDSEELNTYLKEKSKHSFNKHLRQEHGISPPSESSMSSAVVPARPPVAPEEVPSETVKIHIQLEKTNTKKSYRFPKTCTIESFIDFLNEKHGYLGDIVYKGQVLEKVRTFAEYDVNNLDQLEYR